MFLHVKAKRKLKQHYTLNSSSYALLGVVSHWKENKMAMVFNTDFGFQFQKSDSILAKRKAASPLAFPLFVYEEESTTTLFRLVSNRTADGVLMKAYRHFDFLLEIEGDFAQNYADKLLNELKQKKEVIASGILSSTDGLRAGLLSS